jgi:hypothetical protein
MILGSDSAENIPLALFDLPHYYTHPLSYNSMEHCFVCISKLNELGNNCFGILCYT